MRKALLAMATSTALVTAACGGGDSSSSGTGTGGTLTIGSAVVPHAWDLKESDLNSSYQQYGQPVYDTLIRLDKDAKPTPNVATTWAWDSTNTVLTLTLRSGLTFTDGTALDATAVKTNLLNSKAGTSEAAGALAALKSVDVVDPTTVKLTLSAPDPSLLANLGLSPGMLESPAAISSGSDKTTPIGSGPYTLATTGTTAGSQYTYVRNPKYWNAKAFPFDKIVIKVLTDQTARENALRGGQVEAAQVSPVNVKSLASAGFTTSLTGSGDIDGIYIFDRTGKICPALGNVKVRQGLNFAFDRATIAKTLYAGAAQTTSQVFNPDSVAYQTSLNSTYSYDPAKAKQLLAEGGYPNGFSCSAPDFSSLFPQAQAAITQYLGAIGVTVKTVQVAPEQLLTQLLSGKFPMSYFRLSSHQPWDTIQSEIAQNSLWNTLHYNDPQVDSLITKIQSSTGAGQDSAFKDLNQYVLDQAWNVPWTMPQVAYASVTKIRVTPQTYSPEPPIYNYAPAS